MGCSDVRRVVSRHALVFILQVLKPIYRSDSLTYVGMGAHRGHATGRSAGEAVAVLICGPVQGTPSLGLE